MRKAQYWLAPLRKGLLVEEFAPLVVRSARVEVIEIRSVVMVVVHVRFDMAMAGRGEARHADVVEEQRVLQTRTEDASWVVCTLDFGDGIGMRECVRAASRARVVDVDLAVAAPQSDGAVREPFERENVSVQVGEKSRRVPCSG